MNDRAVISQLLVTEIAKYQSARAKLDHELAFRHLGRAHILSQGRWIHHLYIHVLMFEYAWKRKDFHELGGQVLRLIATVPGHLIKRLPTGNIGWSTVGMFQKMPIPEDLKKYLGP